MTLEQPVIPRLGWYLVYTRTQGLDDDTYWVVTDPYDFSTAIGIGDSRIQALLDAGLTEADAEAALSELEQ